LRPEVNRIAPPTVKGPFVPTLREIRSSIAAFPFGGGAFEGSGWPYLYR
jgi:hypothetical protein